jgi:hypothetical protein
MDGLIDEFIDGFIDELIGELTPDLVGAARPWASRVCGMSAGSACQPSASITTEITLSNP